MRRKRIDLLLQTLPRPHSQDLVLASNLARQHLGVIRHQHQPTLLCGHWRARAADRAAAVPTLLWALIQTERYELNPALRRLRHRFCEHARLLAPDRDEQPFPADINECARMFK
jgi:hypothetical protein